MQACYMNNTCIEAGVDEAGRGPLLGPVFAAAVVWNPDLEDEAHPWVSWIRDSKKLSPKKRAELRPLIEAHAVDYAVASCDAARIDAINILQASQEAMHQALDQLSVELDMIVVDGNYFKQYMSKKGEFVPHACIIDGDAKLLSIAAASILAKEAHDDWIKDTLARHPSLAVYGIERNMGYGTREHIAALTRVGPSPFHRASFKTVRDLVITTPCHIHGRSVQVS